MVRSSIEGNWAKDGYLIVRGLLDPVRVEALAALSEKCLRQWKVCNPETGRSGGDDNSRSMRHLNHPGYFEGGARSPDFKLLMQTVADPEVLRVASMCIPDSVGGPLFRSTTLFFNPEGTAANSREGNWHRDSQFVIPDEKDEKRFLKGQVERGHFTFSAGIQMQIALVENDDVQLVPGSHSRWDTAEEYRVRCADGGKHNTEDMPRSLRAALQPGDACLFNAWGFHRGRYHVDIPRRTLMFTYTAAVNPTFDYFSDQPWFMNHDHLDNLNPGTKAFFTKFKSAFEASWRALGADETSTRISEGGSQNRTAQDYRYEPALLQFKKHEAEVSVPMEAVTAVARL